MLLESEEVYYPNELGCKLQGSKYVCDTPIPKGYICIAEGKYYKDLGTIDDLVDTVNYVLARCPKFNEK